MEHRSDIDGLRAVAVLSVVLYHLGFSQRLGGGFVGVDVFFVISGYLITGIVQRDVDAGRLSIAAFYDRRVRRIFPALFVVHASCLVAAAILLFPSEARDVGRDVLWSLVFVSNVVYYRSTGYFDQTAKTSPLLHTWSLSVEEQFYIVLPLLLLALGRVRAQVRIAVIAMLSLASFAAAVWMVRVEPPRAFYLVHYRAWELLLGSLLALGTIPSVKRRALAEVLGATGVALVLVGVLAIKSTTPFPGLWALPPCLGAAAILHSGAEARTLTARLLGSRPLRFVGVISYSLYLWHWPLIALVQSRWGPITDKERLPLLAAALGVSVISQRFVEQPFRQKPNRLPPRPTLRRAAVAMAVVAALAFGVPAAAARLRPHADADAVMAYLKYPATIGARTGVCFLTTGHGAPSMIQKDVCLGVRTDRRNFLIMGDSHAAHLWPAMQALRPDINVMQATASGCGALHGVRGTEKRCMDLFAFMFDQFLPTHHLDAVFIDGRWMFKNLPDLRKTIAYLRPFADRVVVFGPINEYDQPLPRLLAQAMLSGDPTLPARHGVANKRAIDRFLASGLRGSGAEYFSVYDAACPNGDCTVWASPLVPLQYDYGHLTVPGATLVLRRLGPALFR